MDVSLRELKELLCCGTASALPFQVGTQYLFRTIGYHWLGKVKATCGRFLVLEAGAGWVADTGRYSEACSRGILDIPSAEFEPAGRDVLLNSDHITDAVEYPFQIPGGVK